MHISRLSSKVIIFLFCNKKLMFENLKMLFKALKDAQLT